MIASSERCQLLGDADTVRGMRSDWPASGAPPACLPVSVGEAGVEGDEEEVGVGGAPHAMR